VNSVCNVLVTCHEARKIKEFTTDGQLIREVSLQSDVIHPNHAVELTTDQFVVCHGDINDPLHRVCIVDSNGRVLQSYGGSKGSGSGQVNSPVRLAVNGFILVADLNNDRVLMLSPKLTFIREVLTKMRGVLRMSLDVYTGRLYVAG
jgi:hypothetical protein